ncbi:MAG: universal stress protein [Lysobacterales bacterium]
MATIKKILAIANPTRSHQPACERAFALAKALDAELRLHAVVYEPTANFDLFHIADGDHLQHSLKHQAEELLEEIRCPMSATGTVSISTSAQWAHPFDRGVRQAIETDWPDLVMLSTRDAHRLSAAEWRILHASEIPVWLVRDRPWPTQAKIGAFVDPASPNSAHSKADVEVLRWAIALQEFAHEVKVHHAMGVDPRSDDNSEQHRTDQIEQRIRDFTDSPLTMTIAPVEPATLIRGFGGLADAGLAVLGVFSRLRLTELLIGSTAREVIPALNCDVLAVPADR